MKLVKPKKFLGQHFLKDLQVAQDIADTVDACPALPVLEVGPGMGVLTQYLLKKDRPLKVVELDFESVAYLRENFPQLGDHIIEQDFLKMDLRQLFDGRQAHGVVVVIANTLDNLLLLGPHGHRVACVRQHLAESSTPCSCTENRYIFTHIKFLPSLVAQLHRHNLVPCYSPRLPVREPVRLLLSRERAAGFRPRLTTHTAVVPVAFSGELLATNFLQYCVHAFEHAPHQLVHGLGRRLFTP